MVECPKAKKCFGLSAQWLEYLGAESPEGRMFGGLRLKLSAQRLDKRQLGGHAGQRAVVTASVQTVLVVPHPSTPTLGEVVFWKVQAETSVKSTHTWVLRDGPMRSKH